MPKAVVLDWKEYEELQKYKDEQWDVASEQSKKIEEIVKLMREPIPNESPEQRYARTYLNYKVWCIRKIRR